MTKHDLASTGPALKACARCVRHRQVGATWRGRGQGEKRRNRPPSPTLALIGSLTSEEPTYLSWRAYHSWFQSTESSSGRGRALRAHLLDNQCTSTHKPQGVFAATAPEMANARKESCASVSSGSSFLYRVASEPETKMKTLPPTSVADRSAA